MKLRHAHIAIPAAQTWLEALLCHAPDVCGLALILHPYATPTGQDREDELSRTLQAAGWATLGLDLLSAHEEARDPDTRYNIPQLALRIEAVRDWIAHQPELRLLACGLLAEGTACAAAVRAASRHPDDYAALVCRGGRPDLAGTKPLESLQTPTRLVAGALDPGLPMLQQAYAHLRCPRDWRLLPGSDDTFSGPGMPGAYARLALEWLQAYPAAPHGGVDSRS